MNDRNNCSIKLMREFDRLLYKNNVIFAHILQREIKCSYYIKRRENEKQVKIMISLIWISF